MNQLIHCLYGTVLVNIHSYLHFMLTVCTVHIKVYCMVQFFCYETTSQQKYAHAHNMLFNSKCTQLLVILFMVWYVYYALKLFHDVRVNTCPAALSWVRKTPIVRSKKESIKKRSARQMFPVNIPIKGGLSVFKISVTLSSLSAGQQSSLHEHQQTSMLLCMY